MSIKLPTNVTTMGKAKIKEWLTSYDMILTDCDGVLWTFENVIGKAPEVINKFVANGKKVYFITNNSTKTRQEFVQKNKALKFNVGIDGIISTAYLSAVYLEQLSYDKKVYVIGSPAIGKELDAVGIAHIGIGPDPVIVPLTQLLPSLKLDPDVRAVVVGFDEHLSYSKMVKAATYLQRPGAIFIGTNLDDTLITPSFIIPGATSMVKCIEECANKKATIMGKPSSIICDIFKEFGRKSKKCLMIGDTLNADIVFGKRCNFETLLVESGVNKIEDVQKIIETLEGGSDNQDLKDQVPDYYIKELGDLLEFLDDEDVFFEDNNDVDDSLMCSD